MANVIIILILIIIGIYSVRSYMKKLRNGCCGGGCDVEEKIKVRDKNPGNYPYTAAIGIEGMTCGRCKTRVENALNLEDGVWAQVDLKKRQALVHMKKELSDDELRRIIIRAGYIVTGIDR